MADIGFLGDVLVRIDRSGTPPWPAYAWNTETRAWDAIGIVGAQGPAGPAGPSYAPLMTGDAAPTMIGTGDGQPVLVSIS